VTAQREWLDKDYYAVLDVPRSATPKEITSAYRKLARQFHPDANPGNAAAEDRFKSISAAYEVVGDETRRREYDEIRAMAPMAGMRGAGAPGGDGVRLDQSDLGDLLGNLFGRGQGGPTTGRPGGFSRGPQRGVDLEADLRLSFVDAIRGVTTSVNLVSEVTCPDCSGSGAAVGTMPRVCPDCRGRGVLDDNQGLFSFSRPCDACGGRGQVVDTPCPACSARGVVTRPRTVKVRLPEGVRDGQQIRLKGKGGPGQHNGPPGDLYVRVLVEPHGRFGRDGDHLTVTIPVSYPDAVLGANAKVPTIEGDTVTIRIPPGTPAGRTLRVRNRGITTASGRGDLLVTVDLVVPTELDTAQRSAVEQLRNAFNGVTSNSESGAL